jgi:hypothetical protein
MQTLQWISVIMAMVLGLGVTRLLTALVAIFKTRRRITIDWVPVAWAGALFLTQLQFWWALGDLAAIKSSFPYLHFLGLVTLPLMLFLTAALLLPSGEEALSLRSYFEEDGKWALVSLSAFFAGALVVNWQLFQATPFALWGLIDVALIALPLLIALTRSRALHVAITAITVPLIVADTIVASYYA